MVLRHTILLIALTLAYLVLELSFNARLLDVVGGASTAAEIEKIERFGRTLSGVAVALVVLQLMLRRRASSDAKAPGLLVIGIACSAVVFAVFLLLDVLVDQIVKSASPETRRLSASTALLQRALVDRVAVLQGVGDDPGIFARPEGKAFLALFPLMALSVSRLDEKIGGAKLAVIRRQVDRKLGGAAGLYKEYEGVRKALAAQWNDYRGAPRRLADSTSKAQDQAWRDYVGELGRKGWTPSTIPARHRSQVVANVRKRVGVPVDWNPGDQSAFRSAVAKDVQRKSGANPDGSLLVEGVRVPPGLSFEAFFTHPAIQQRIRQKASLPARVEIRPEYRSQEEFRRELHEPTLRTKAQDELMRINAPASTFADGNPNAALGLEAARSVLVPPIALLFSLAGAIGHAAKLGYLVTVLAIQLVPSVMGLGRRLAWVIPVVVIAGTWTWLANRENDLTQSDLYRYMLAQIERESEGLRGAVLSNVIHVVAVGQGHGYPFNERVRNDILGGFDFGYRKN